MKRCGLVAVIGETNAGKSTLINKMVGQKVSIVSRKAQTTLYKINGIAIHGECQIIFMDTPGFSRVKHIESLAKIAWDTFREADEVLFVVDVCKKKFDTTIALLKRIHEAKRVSLVMNKIDLIHKPKLLEITKVFSEVRNFENVFMVSGLTGSGVERILDFFSNYLPENEWIYDEDTVTDLSFEKYSSEITREHIYHRLHEEIPYKCVVKTDDCQDQPDGSIRIVQTVYVKSETHRAIFLGHGGGKIKAIGAAARQELSTLLDKEVHLFLHVLISTQSNL
ncbi:MAG: GTPase Era [Holosporaceae bacterium]|nr:GTPase Era [Holosporaceae bacterium]